MTPATDDLLRMGGRLGCWDWYNYMTDNDAAINIDTLTYAAHPTFASLTSDVKEIVDMLEALKRAAR